MIRIFVEGRDAQFLEKYLVFLWGENRERWEILQTNGYTNLPLLDQKFKENTEQGGVNLIIFDADFPQNGGGCDQRKKYLQEQLDNLSISADIFLFPNDREDGDFEVLLEHIVNEEHACLLKCFEGYEKCVAGHVNPDGSLKYISPNRKAKIYAYIESLKKSRKETERFKKQKDFFFDNPKYWNLETEYLSPLKNFLQSAENKHSNSAL